MFVEEWADMAAVKAHFAVPASGEFVQQLWAWAVGRPVIKIFEAEEVKA